MLLVVVVLFAVFWLPLQTFSLIMFLFPEIRGGIEYQSTAYNIVIATYFLCHWLSMAHSCLNPLVYCFMNKKFRTNMHNLLCDIRAFGRGAGNGGGGKVGGSRGALDTYGSTATTSRGHHASGHSTQGGGHTSSSALNKGGSGSPHTSNSARILTHSASNSHQLLSKTNSLTSIRTTSRPLASQTSSELNNNSKVNTPDEHQRQVTTGRSGGNSQEEPGEREAPEAEGAARERRGRAGARDDSVSMDDEQAQGAQATSSSPRNQSDQLKLDCDHEHEHRRIPTFSVQFSVENNSGCVSGGGEGGLVSGSNLFERPIQIMSKLSETSATDTLQEINEEDEDEDEDEESESESESENEEASNGRKVTIKHQERDYVILEPKSDQPPDLPAITTTISRPGDDHHIANV